MTSKLLLSFTIFALIVLGASAQTTQAQPNNTVAVNADGNFETAPDTGNLQFDITAQDKTSNAAYARLSKAIDAVRQILRDKNIEVKNAEMSHFSVQPLLDWKSSTKRKVIGYRLNTRVNLNLKDFEKIGPLMEAISTVDEVENQLVTYSIENIDQAKKLAVENGMSRARSLAETVAAKSGRTIGALYMVSVDTATRTATAFLTPYDRLRPLMAYKEIAEEYTGADQTGGAIPTTSEFGTKSISVIAHVRAVFELQ